MSEEALLVLKMVQEGKITPEQGVAFLEALKSTPPSPTPQPASSAANGNTQAPHDSGIFGGWGSVSQMQRRLAETQQRLAEMQAKLGAAQAGANTNGSSHSTPSVKLPFGMGEFNLTQILDDVARGAKALSTEAVISAKKARRQAEKEVRKFRQEAERVGKNIHVEVRVTSEERPHNTANLPQANAVVETSCDLAEAGHLSIGNGFGDITVTGTSADGKVHVTVNKTVWASTVAECEAALREVAIEQTPGPDNGLSLAVSPGPNGSDNRIEVNLTIQAPPTAVISAATTFGKVQCESLEGGVKRVETHSGEIRLLHVFTADSNQPSGLQTRSGNISASQWRGGTLFVETVSGTVQLDLLESEGFAVHTHSADTHLRNSKFSGNLRVETVSGDIQADHNVVQGTCILKSASGDLDISKITAANLTLETVSGDAQINGCACAAGRVTIKSISGDLEAEGVSSQGMAVNTTSGDAEVTVHPGFDGSISGATVSGDITLKLPSAYAARLTMTTHSGTLRCDFPLIGKEGDGEHFISGQIGSADRVDRAGSATLMVQSVSGDLVIERQS